MRVFAIAARHLAACLCLASCGLDAQEGTVSSELTVLPPDCEPTKLYVDVAAQKGGNGSKQAPFSSLREALTAAGAAQACAVRVLMAPGAYVEGPITVTLPTVVDGGGASIRGSFEALSPALVLSDVVLEADPQIPYPAVRAMKGPVLVLRDVKIVAPGGHAIRQHGGTLRVAGLEVSGTQTISADPASGSAVHLTGGVDATLTLMTLSGSVRGLYAGDPGTRVRGNGIVVEDTTVHPTRRANVAAAGSCEALGFQYLGAVEVDSGAELSGSLWWIRRSQIVGLYAHDGGSATLSRIEIDDVAMIPEAGGCGGFGAFAHRGGAIDLTRLAITNLDLCGVVVGDAPGSEMDLRTGYIDYAPVGACVQQEGYDVRRLSRGVQYRSHLGIPLDATSLPFPDIMPF